MLIIAQVQSSVLPAGAATETTLAAILAKLNASVVVTGPLTDTQLRAAAVPVTGPLTDAQLRASAVLVGAVSLPLPTGAAQDASLAALSAQLPASIGQTTMASSLPVVLASNQSAVPVTGPQTDAQLRAYAATNIVTATAAVGVGVTCTLPAPGVGNFVYITSIRITKLYAILGVANAAGVVITSTNLPGSLAWTTEQAAGPLGTCPVVVNEAPSLPIKSSAANAITTIVCPAQAQTIWRVTVAYYIGP